MSWEPVPGYEGYYAVSDRGTVYSLRKERELKPKIDRYGYEVVTLTVHGHSKCFTIHRLVALAFIPNPYNKPTVNHKDENKRNNAVSNLEWATHKENDNHGTRNQRMSKSKCRRAVIGLFPDGSTKTFDGVKAASDASGIAHSQIAKCCKGIIKQTHNIEWRYYDEVRRMA